LTFDLPSSSKRQSLGSLRPFRKGAKKRTFVDKFSSACQDYTTLFTFDIKNAFTDPWKTRGT
ncbi:hypothetical protein, partial [Sporosarcina newyorkensis]|uniref:hypothetical protein n=1 Tax=Sporosarcina newyorkensis TaxID=759851 RepID=UPI003CFEFA13